MMTQPSTILLTSRTPRRISPGDLELPPTQPIDISALIAAELAARFPNGSAGY